jgi:hypothetical protein
MDFFYDYGCSLSNVSPFFSQDQTAFSYVAGPNKNTLNENIFMKRFQSSANSHSTTNVKYFREDFHHVCLPLGPYSPFCVCGAAKWPYHFGPVIPAG